jgi:hypothetical protein
MGNRIARSIGGVGIILGSVILLVSPNWHPGIDIFRHLVPLGGIGLGLLLILVPSRK